MKRPKKQVNHSTHTPSPLKALNERQTRHLNAVKSQTCVIATGPAGVGKTYVHAAWAAQSLMAGHIDTVILTRPVVEAGRPIGYLKGDANEKMAPYISPFRDVFVKYMGASFFDYCVKVERIRPIPMCLIQGCSWSDSVILADELENATVQELKLLLTRVGENSKILISGDPTQKYIREESGLADAIERLVDVPGVSVIRYGIDDVVRSPFVRHVLAAYEGVSYAA